MTRNIAAALTAEAGNGAAEAKAKTVVTTAGVAFAGGGRKFCEALAAYAGAAAAAHMDMLSAPARKDKKDFD